MSCLSFTLIKCKWYMMHRTTETYRKIFAGTTGKPEEPPRKNTLYITHPFDSQWGCLRNHEAQFSTLHTEKLTKHDKKLKKLLQSNLKELKNSHGDSVLALKQELPKNYNFLVILLTRSDLIAYEMNNPFVSLQMKKNPPIFGKFLFLSSPLLTCQCEIIWTPLPFWLKVGTIIFFKGNF